MTIVVTAYPGTFGATIEGFDLNHSTPEDHQLFHRWIDQYKVLVFTNQSLSLEELEQFAMIFGTLDTQQGTLYDGQHNSTPIPVTPYISMLKRDPPSSVPTALFGSSWHSDFANLPTPPHYTLLYADQVPDQGGDTLFLDQAAAYHRLPPYLQEKLLGVKGIFSSPLRPSDPTRYQGVHPLIQQHPRTRETYLFDSPSNFVQIEGMDYAESSSLIREILTSTLPSDDSADVLRIQWTPKMLVVWDNRRTIHKATKTLSPQPRILYRVEMFDK